MLERVMREIRRRTRVVGSFPDGRSAAVRLGQPLGHGRYMDMNRLKKIETTELQAADKKIA